MPGRAVRARFVASEGAAGSRWGGGVADDVTAGEMHGAGRHRGNWRMELSCMAVEKISCLLIGEGPLLMQCGDLLLARGHRIHAVVSGSPVVFIYISGVPRARSIIQSNRNP